MKLLRYGPMGQEKPAILDKNGDIRDLSGQCSDIQGSVLSPESLARLALINPETLPLVTGKPRIGAPVTGLRNFVCIGLNYADHAAETGAAVPTEPIVFLKSLSALSGPYDDIVIPPGSKKTDWECELGVVMGSLTRRVSEQDAMKHIAGYTVINDVSEREWQIERGGAWDKGKGFDSFGPIGPYLVTQDEVADPQNLGLFTEVDGQMMQNGSTKTMVFTVPQLVSYVSQCFTLYPGDVIATGTPPGVGLGIKPNPVFLRPGQTVRLGVQGLGEQVHKTV